jgi:hypothetical protein
MVMTQPARTTVRPSARKRTLLYKINLRLHFQSGFDGHGEVLLLIPVIDLVAVLLRVACGLTFNPSPSAAFRWRSSKL